ncbi:MAG TPA: hypothetical protein VEM93_01345, partial [Actinomycetota bacterium]|nr:hypothetical protein [Actinomycetota bacterium]
MRSTHGHRGAARLVAGLAVAGIVMLYGAGVAEAASVSMEDNVFSPTNITITAGETITWTNNGQNQHTATADDGSFDT